MRTLLFIASVFCFANMASQIKFTPDTVREIDIRELKEIKEKAEREEKPFVSTEQLPEFAGGKEAFQKFVDENLKYNPQYKNNTSVPNVVIRFVVKKDGCIANPQVRKGDDASFASTVLELIDKMPKWIPGKQCGVTVPVYYTVRFWYSPSKSKIIVQYP
jgi:protein TonB